MISGKWKLILQNTEKHLNKWEHWNEEGYSGEKFSSICTLLYLTTMYCARLLNIGYFNYSRIF